jgi:hypothetical protein
MDEQRIARWFGLAVGSIFACGLVFNALAYYQRALPGRGRSQLVLTCACVLGCEGIVCASAWLGYVSTDASTFHRQLGQRLLPISFPAVS